MIHNFFKYLSQDYLPYLYLIKERNLRIHANAFKKFILNAISFYVDLEDNLLSISDLSFVKVYDKIYILYILKINY